MTWPIICVVISAFGLGAIYVLLALRDIFQALFLNGRLATHNGRVKRSPKAAWTALGARFENELSLIIQRARIFECPVPKSAERASAVLNMNEDANIPDNREMQRRLLEFVIKRTKADSAAIITQGHAEEKPNIVSLHITGPRFESALREHTSEYFVRGTRDKLGFRDGYLSESVLGEFSVFGFRFTQTEALTWGPRNNQKRAVLWFGYSSEHQPAQANLKIGRELARILEREMSVWSRLIDLSGSANEAARANQEKSEFITHLSHDIKSPINNINSVLSLLRVEAFTSNENSDHGELIDVARNNCISLMEIVESLLDYSKHQAGKLKAHPEEVDLVALTRSVVESYVISAKLKGLTLEFAGAVDVAPAWVDRRQLRRAITNLVSNAIKYTEFGKVSVKIEGRITGRWRISIIDSGCGISAEDLNKLFIPFSRAAGAEVEGVGLGLALSKILLNLNCGEIGVSSERNRGSEFWVEVNQLLDVPKNRTMGSKVENHFDFNETVLVIDDDRDCAETLARALRRAGCQVAVATSLHEAAAVINFEPVSIVISDVSMPGGGVRQVLGLLQTQAERAEVLVITGREGKEEELSRLGVSAYLEKPADINEILEWIKYAAIRLKQSRLSAVPALVA